MPNDNEVREAIARAVNNDVGRDSYQIWFAGALNALSDEPAVKKFIAQFVSGQLHGEEAVKPFVTGEHLYERRVGAALKALAKECG